jgi:hypothetical protein
MPNSFRVGVIAIALALGGCAIHPLPDDVTGVSTNDIVRKIRCEARDAVRAKLVAWLVSRGNDERARAIGAELSSGAMSLDTFSTKGFAPSTVLYINYFSQSVIAYNFTFDMTELNNLDATVDLISPLKRGPFTAALGAGIDRTRENTRTFTISDSFHRMVYEIHDDYCDGFTHEPNYIYPIAGKIGIAEMIDTFVDLALFGGLAPGGGGAGAQGSAQAPKTASMTQAKPTTPGPLAMGDTIAFQTKLSGSATPKIVLTPIGKSTQLADASLAAAVSRTDVHKLIIGISVPVAFNPSAQSLTKPGTRSLFTQIAHPVGQTPEERALEMIAQQIFRFEHPVGTSALVLGD